MKVNKNSWHYRLNLRFAIESGYTPLPWQAQKYVESKDTICSYLYLTALNVFTLLFRVLFIISGSVFLITILALIIISAPIAVLISVGLVLTIIGIAAVAHHFRIVIERRTLKRINHILYDNTPKPNSKCNTVEFSE